MVFQAVCLWPSVTFELWSDGEHYCFTTAAWSTTPLFEDSSSRLDLFRNDSYILFTQWVETKGFGSIEIMLFAPNYPAANYTEHQNEINNESLLETAEEDSPLNVLLHIMTSFVNYKTPGPPGKLLVSLNRICSCKILICDYEWRSLFLEGVPVWRNRLWLPRRNWWLCPLLSEDENLSELTDLKKPS